MSPGLENGTAWCRYSGGAGEVRTRDPLLAKQVLYQLSYDPEIGRLCCEKNNYRNLLCAINRNPEDSGYYSTASFDHRRESQSSVAVSLERR